MGRDSIGGSAGDIIAQTVATGITPTVVDYSGDGGQETQEFPASGSNPIHKGRL